MRTKAHDTASAAVTGALYAALTYLSALMGFAYGPVQFRLSEALTVLPIFSPASVWGLTVGCILSNMLSTVSPLDMIFGSLATLLAAVLTRLFRNVTVINFPLLSFLMPVVINGITVGAEISLLGTERASFTLFITNAVSVALGELAVVFTAGAVLFFLINKNKKIRQML